MLIIAAIAGFFGLKAVDEITGGFLKDLFETLFSSLVKFFMELIYKAAIGLSAIVYSISSYLYQIFIGLASINVFDNSAYQTIVSKMYIIVGVIALFAVAYTVITYIIDPTKDKGSAEALKLVKNVIITIVLIILCPVAFNYSVKIQSAIIRSNLIGKIISNQPLSSFVISYDENGNETTHPFTELKDETGGLVHSFFRSFFKPVDFDEEDKEKIQTWHELYPNLIPDVDEFIYDNRASQTNASIYLSSMNYTENGVKQKVNCKQTGSCTLRDVDKYVIATGDYHAYKAFALNIYDGNMTFSWFISFAVGCYLCYILLSFSIDMGVRAIKLVFYQILAPICIATMIVPGNISKVAKSWFNAVWKTYVAVFIRITLLSLTVYLIAIINSNWSAMFNKMCDDINCSWGVEGFAKIILFLACLTFMKTGSKMICELFGFDDVKIGIKGKLKDSGAFMAGAAIGTGVTNAARRAYQSDEFQKAGQSSGKKKAGHILKGVGQTVMGFAGGVAAGGKAGQNAGSATEMISATQNAVQSEQVKRRQKALEKSQGVGLGSKMRRWFTGQVEESNVNNSIVAQGKAMTDSAEAIARKHAMEGKSYDYGIDASHSYSLNGANLNGTSGTIPLSNDHLAYNTDILHRLDQLINIASQSTDGKVASGETLTVVDSSGVSRNVDMGGVSRSELEALRENFVGDFAKEMCAVALNRGNDYTRTPGNGSDYLDQIYRDGLELQTLIANNQTSAIVQELQTLETSIVGAIKDSEKSSATRHDFFRADLFKSIKEANERVLNAEARKKYESGFSDKNVGGGSGSGS